MTLLNLKIKGEVIKIKLVQKFDSDTSKNGYNKIKSLKGVHFNNLKYSAIK